MTQRAKSNPPKKIWYCFDETPQNSNFTIKINNITRFLTRRARLGRPPPFQNGAPPQKGVPMCALRSRLSWTSLASCSAILLSGAALSSCSLKQQLDQMHDATVAVPEKLNGMKNTTDQMKATTCTMYRSMRQGSSKISRDQDFEDIVRAKDVAGRLAEAAEYMQGFEYQVWAQVCADELPREIVLEQAMKELLAKIQTFSGRRNDVSATQSSNEMQVMYALSATLHYVNALQESMLGASDEKVLRPFDILVEGLKIDMARTDGSYSEATVPAWAEVVGKYQKDAVYLLRLRQNFLLAYAYSLADSDAFGTAPGTLAKLKRLIFSDYLNRKWTPGLASRSPTEINDRITAALIYSAETTEALQALGVDPLFDSTVFEFWERADFSSFQAERLSQSAVPKERIFGQAVLKLAAARDRVVQAWKKSQERR